MNQTTGKKRIDWIDCAKGIAIILVVMGHTVRFDTEAEKLIRGSIFSFHMPLFFILSGITFRLFGRFITVYEKNSKSLSSSYNTCFYFIRNKNSNPDN